MEYIPNYKIPNSGIISNKFLIISIITYISILYSLPYCCDKTLQ